MSASGQRIDVIAHSWGSVVAYDALRQLEDDGLPGRIGNFFTVGAALAISFIADRLRPSDGRKPTLVDRWFNLDATGDIAGGSLQAVGLSIDREYLDLVPTDCDSFGWPLKLYKPACTHSSYFHIDNAIVNRDIFAAAMNASNFAFASYSHTDAESVMSIVEKLLASRKLPVISEVSKLSLIPVRNFLCRECHCLSILYFTLIRIQHMSWLSSYIDR